MKQNDWKRFKIWDEWRNVTRFLRSAQIAFDAEMSKWNSLPVSDLSEIQLAIKTGKSNYKVMLPEHLEVLKDNQTLFSMTLQASLALIEEHARDVLRELHTKGHSLSPVITASKVQEAIDKYPPKGIEGWGTRLLALVKRSWADVNLGGLAGIIEVVVVRNALAHGQPAVSQSMLNRVHNAGGTLPWALNDPVVISFDIVNDYRERLRSFARVLADATAQIR